MSRVHLHAVGQDEQSVGQAPVQVDGRQLPAEVGSAHVTDEQGVTGEHEPRLAAPRAVGNQQRNAVRGVAGCMEDLERHTPDRELVTIIGGRMGVCRLRGRVDIETRTALGGEGLVARHVIGVDMGLDDPGDREALSAGQGQIVIDALAPRIHHHRLPSLAAADQVGEASRLFVEDLLEDHVEIFPHGRTVAQARPWRGWRGPSCLDPHGLID